MKRIRPLVVAAALLGAHLSARASLALGSDAAPAVVSDAIVLEWNEIAVQAVGASPAFPSTRAMAIVQLAVFEAVNAITHQYTPYLGTVSGPPGASTEAAVVTAAHDTLVWLFPVQQAVLDGRQAASLATIPDGQAKEDGMATGQAAAWAMIDNRTDDGSSPAQFYTPTSTAPYEWQPTPSCAAAPANNRGLFFHWQFVKPFGVSSAAQFRAPQPPALWSLRYTRDFNEVKTVGDMSSMARPKSRAEVARFYAAQFPHRGWNMVARQLAAARHDGLPRTARILALLNLSMSDAHVTVFESKYFYRTWRPETAIHRADEDGNPFTTPDPTYSPFIVTPCFPSYPSAHGSGGGAGREVLERFYGRKGHRLALTEPAVPDVVLHYSDLRDITDDVSDARVYGGIHYRYDQVAADRLGESVARWNLHHLLRPVWND